MKALLLAAVAALAPNAEPAKPAQCQIAIRYMSDEPAKVELDLPKTLPCGSVAREDVAITAAVRLVRGLGP